MNRVEFDIYSMTSLRCGAEVNIFVNKTKTVLTFSSSTYSLNCTLQVFLNPKALKRISKSLFFLLRITSYQLQGWDCETSCSGSKFDGSLHQWKASKVTSCSHVTYDVIFSLGDWRASNRLMRAIPAGFQAFSAKSRPGHGEQLKATFCLHFYETNWFD